MPDFFTELSLVAKSYPHSLALISKSGNLDHRDLVQAIESIAGHTLNCGLTAGQVVHVETDDDDTRLLMFLGLMRAGLTVALLQSVGRAFVDTGVDPDVVVTEWARKSPLARRAKQVVRFSREWFRGGRQSGMMLPDDPDYSLIYASSGTTGRHKLIVMDRPTIQYKFDRYWTDPYYRSEVRFLADSGETTSASFPYYLPTLATGGSVIRLDGYQPGQLIAACRLLRPSYAKLSPMSLVQVVRLLRREPQRLRKVDYLNQSGAYCAVSVRREASELFAERVFTTYATTELGHIARGELAEIGDTEGSVGRICEGMTVEVIDDNGRKLPTGAAGEIRVKPPADVGTRYLTTDGLRDVLEDGWFYPGDIGLVDTSGQLIITGRKSAVINLGGNKIDPEVAEDTLLGLDGVEDVAVAGVVGEHGFQVVRALVVTGRPLGLDEINRYLAGRHARFWVDTVGIVSEIPRTASRKIDRQAVREIANGL